MVEKWIQIYCDMCYETVVCEVVNETVKNFRKELKEKGWRYYKGTDVCPKCKKRVIE